MGYLVLTIGLAVLVIALVASLLQRRRSSTPRRLAADRPVEHAEPAADEPTPGASRSTNATAGQRAQERTPPA